MFLPPFITLHYPLQVAFLGCGARCNTSMHGVEELLSPSPPPYLLQESTIEYTVTDGRGSTSTTEHRRHAFDDALTCAGW